MQAEVLLDDPLEFVGCHLREPFVLEVEIQERVPRGARLEPIGEALPQEGGLAAAPHADHGHRLAFDAGQMDIAPGVVRDRCGERIGDLRPDELFNMSFHER
jgi:hypothetical protein